jgi:CubicO group peptidase (beta-lactamase class C family)
MWGAFISLTLVAVLKLIEMGKLSLNTRLLDCVNVDFPNYAPQITIRHLLTHSSGITSYFEEDVKPDYEAVWKDWPMYNIWEPRDFLPLFQHKGMKFPPGETNHTFTSLFSSALPKPLLLTGLDRVRAQ